ncbi:MAG: hypothetical protein ABUS51_05295 [Acidobacteriota bacterium]
MRAARRGDWDAVEQLTAVLARKPVPREPDALYTHLRSLKEALVVAKACRAALATSATRLNAAATFQQLVDLDSPSGSGAESQNPGAPTES